MAHLLSSAMLGPLQEISDVVDYFELTADEKTLSEIGESRRSMLRRLRVCHRMGYLRSSTTAYPTYTRGK